MIDQLIKSIRKDLIEKNTEKACVSHNGGSNRIEFTMNDDLVRGLTSKKGFARESLQHCSTIVYDLSKLRCKADAL